MLQSSLECLQSIGIEGTLLKNSDEQNDGEGVRASDSSALSGAENQSSTERKVFLAQCWGGGPTLTLKTKKTFTSHFLALVRLDSNRLSTYSISWMRFVK